MRWLWRDLRKAGPVTAACQVLLGVMVILTGATASPTTTGWRWYNAALIAFGVIYVLVSCALLVLARRDQKRQPVEGRADSPHA